VDEAADAEIEIGDHPIELAHPVRGAGVDEDRAAVAVGAERRGAVAALIAPRDRAPPAVDHHPISLDDRAEAPPQPVEVARAATAARRDEGTAALARIPADD